MTKPDGVAATEATGGGDSPSWEDLLLAFAVNRHGTAAWDSVADELHKRKISLDPHRCRLSYLHLKRRFAACNGDTPEDDKSDGGGGVEESVPLLEELRKLRVAELRRQVQRYDLNIESLEMKKKEMEEERERSLKTTGSDPDEQPAEEEQRGGEPAETGGEPAAGEEVEKDRLSVNESNSTDPEADKSRTGEKESEPAAEDRAGSEPAELKLEPDPKPAREDSCNGSSNSIEKGKAEAAETAESGGGGGGDEDVQSSASRSRKEEEGGDKVRRGSTSGDEREHDDQSPAVKDLGSVESQPLVDFLRALRAHKTGGSVFLRRLRSQESTKYQKLILQHIDIETIEARLKEGLYSGSLAAKFFRDLLLLVNNALIFFAKNSPEANAALEIRRLISKEISQKNTKSDSSSGKQVSLQSLSMSKKETAETPPQSLLLKPRIPGTLIVCRKRSSIAAKASASSSGTDKKKEPTPSLAEEKEKDKDSAKKQQHSLPSSDADEPKTTKKRTRDNRIASAPANTKKNNGKNQSTNNKNSAAEPTKQQGKGGGSSSQAVPEPSKKGQTTMESKKRGAANFLNRMKQGSSSSNNNGVLLDALKNTPLTGESTSGKGDKKNEGSGGKRGGEKKDPPVAVTRRSLETRQQVKEKGSPGKRNVGRPPKRGAAAPPPPPALGKRGRDRGEAETAASKQPKKRTRKL